MSEQILNQLLDRITNIEVTLTMLNEKIDELSYPSEKTIKKDFILSVKRAEKGKFKTYKNTEEHRKREDRGSLRKR